MTQELTEEEKRAACERICGESGKRGIHRIAPVRCPIEDMYWKNPKLKREN